MNVTNLKFILTKLSRIEGLTDNQSILEETKKIKKLINLELNSIEKVKHKILLVDDSEVMRKLLVSILEIDYEIEVYGNAIEGLSRLQTGYTPDIILTDLMMPVMSGVEFVTQLKSSGSFKNIPIMVLSSIDKSEEKSKLLDLGVCDYLEKPFNPRELISRIGKLINISKSINK